MGRVRRTGFGLIGVWLVVLGVWLRFVTVLWPYSDWIVAWIFLCLTWVIIVIFSRAVLDALSCLGPYWWKRRD